MGLTYQMKMKIPFDMADMNGHVKLPDVILLSLQVSGMQSIELGVSDKAILEDYNLVWIITDYDIEVVRLPRFAEEITIETEALSYNRLFCYRRFTIMMKQVRNSSTWWRPLFSWTETVEKFMQ